MRETGKHLDAEGGVLEDHGVEGEVDLPVVEVVGALDDEVAGVRLRLVRHKPLHRADLDLGRLAPPQRRRDGCRCCE